MKKSIADAVIAAMEARDSFATAGNNDGSLGRQLDENTTEYDVPNEDPVEKKVKFQPRMFEYNCLYSAKMGKRVSFDTFITVCMDDYFDLLGMEAVIRTRRALGPSILQSVSKS